MSEPAQAFSLGLTYWPRGAGPLLWQRYDRGAVQEELAHIAALGCDTIRLCLSWEDFQPGAERLHVQALRYLEHALDAAQQSGLRVVAQLFPATLMGVLQLPAWANSPDVIGQLRRAASRRSLVIIRPAGMVAVLAGGRYRPIQAGDLFSEPFILEAQRYFIREVGGYFGSHPAIGAWQLGEGFGRAHRAESAATAARWYAAMGDELRRVAPRAALLGVIDANDLKRRAGPRPAQLAQSCNLLGVAVDPPETPAAEQTRHSTPAAFLHALTAGIAERRVIVADVGMPGVNGNLPSGWQEEQLFGRATTLYHGTIADQAAFLETTLERLYRDGAAGVWLAAYADYPEELWRIPPLDRVRRYRMMGLIDAGGREKPAAEVVRDMARRLRNAPNERAQPPAVDAERYWNNPARTFDELWREFNSDNHS